MLKNILVLPVSIAVSVLFCHGSASLLWLMVAAVSALLLFWPPIKAFIPKGYTVLLILFVAVFGWQWGLLGKQHFSPIQLSQLQAYWISGAIVGVPQKRYSQWQVRVKLDCIGSSQTDCIYLDPAIVSWPVYADVSLANGMQPVPGQSVRLNVKPSPIKQQQNPRSFDVEPWLMASHVISRFRLVKGSQYNVLSANPWSVDYWRFHLHQIVEEKIKKGDELSAYPVILALITGDRTLMSDRHWDVFNRTGTTHLVAISGLHIGLVAGLVMWLFTALFRRWLWFTYRYPASSAGAVSALIAATGYAAIAGFALPTQRALCMLAVFVFLKLVGRAQQLWVGWSVALLLVLLWDPVSVLSMGFWLSFLAVFCIIGIVGGQVVRSTTLDSWLKVQIGLTIGLLPFMVWKLQYFSIVSIATNIVAIPVIGFLVTPVSLLAAVTQDVFPLLANMLFSVSASITHWMIVALEFSSQWSGSIWATGPQHWAAALLAFIGVLWLFLLGVPGRGFAPLLMLPLLISQKSGFGLYVLQSPSQPQLAVYGADRLMIVSPGFWPKLIPQWQQQLMEHVGIDWQSESLKVDAATNLWASKGLVATEYHLQRDLLGRQTLKSVRYYDLCNEDKSFDTLGVVGVYMSPKYSRHCAVNVRYNDESWLLWPTKSVLSQRFIVENTTRDEPVDHLVLWQGAKEHLNADIFKWLAHDADIYSVKAITEDQEQAFLSQGVSTYDLQEQGFRFIEQK